MEIMNAQRNYNEYQLDNVLLMSPELFSELLSEEFYSLVLMYRLIELRSNFEDMEAYEYCHAIQSFFDENNIKV